MSVFEVNNGDYISIRPMGLTNFIRGYLVGKTQGDQVLILLNSGDIKAFDIGSIFRAAEN